MTRKEVNLQRQRCESCRYKHLTCMDEPCRTGNEQIIFEGRCREYRTDLLTKIRYKLKGLVK